MNNNNKNWMTMSVNMKGADCYFTCTMSSSGEASDEQNAQIVHVIQPPVNSSASSGALEVESKDMQPNVGGVVHPVGGVSQTHHLHQHLDSASPSQQYTVEEQITTVRIPMRRPSPSFLEILQEGGASSEVFTMKEIIHHVKNYIIKHQLFDQADPRVVHCRNNKLGQVFQVDKFTINEAIPLFMKNTLPLPDSCICIRRQLVKRVVDSQGATSAAAVPQVGSSCATATVTSTTGGEGTTEGGGDEEGGSASISHHQPQGEWGLQENCRASMNIEFGDEVDGTMPMLQVNLESSNPPPLLLPLQAPEEDSVSLQYDSDHFAVEYDLEPSDHRSESEHGSHDSPQQPYLVVQESDVEFWADYSDTETSSDAELGDADHWLCQTCQTRNVPFYRNCSKCWALRPHWLPDSSLPSSTSSAQLPAEPCGALHGYYAASSESNDEQRGSGRGSLRQWRLGDKVRRRRIVVVSASSPDRNSESLASLSDDEAPSTSTGGREESRVGGATLASSQGTPTSQETEGGDGLSRHQPGLDSRRKGGGKWGRGGKDSDRVVPSADVCMVCASRPKTGCIIHGSSGHQVCCYRCAKRLKRKGLPCLVCRRPIQKVIKNFVL